MTEGSATSPALLKRLEPLVGEWSTEVSLPSDPANVLRSRTTFEWMEGGSNFLVWRASSPGPNFPSGLSIIGCDVSPETITVHYFDSRGISRIYEMSLDDGVLKIWREGPDFAQRFTGRFSDDGNTITGAWENSSDGVHWEHDFDLTYTKVNADRRA
jgi:hypothetical protein